MVKVVRWNVGGHLGFGELDAHGTAIRRKEVLALQGAHGGGSAGYILELNERNRNVGIGDGAVVVDVVVVVVVIIVLVVVVVHVVDDSVINRMESGADGGRSSSNSSSSICSS